MDSMESREDTFRVKQEPGDTWPDASGNYDFDSMDFGEVKNVEKLQLYELSTNNMNQAMMYKELDEKIFIDFESKDVKPELYCSLITVCKTEDRSLQFNSKKENENQSNGIEENIINEIKCKDVEIELNFLSTSFCKTEDQSLQPNMTIEKENQSNITNGNKIIDFECKDVKLELNTLQTSVCKTEDQNLQHNMTIEKENQSSSTNENIIIDFECKDVNLKLILYQQPSAQLRFKV
ncbi:hypothetical protein TKK_0007136 [Trichogramma kaykai]